MGLIELGRKILTIGVTLLLWLSLFPIAIADSAPLAKEEVYLTLRQNRQLASIEVYENYQDMELFISVTSLDPGENIRFAVPLKTLPFDVQHEEITDQAFMSRIRLSSLKRSYEEQSDGFGRVMSYTGQIVNFLASGMISMIYGVMGGLAGDSSMLSYYDFGGVTVEIYSVDEAGTMENLLQSLDFDLPEEITEMLANYSEDYVVVIEAETKPPVSENQYNAIQSQAPGALADFKDYVATHPRTITYGGWWVGFEDPELESIIDSVSNSDVRQNFISLVGNTYGLGEADGFTLSFRMPLYENSAYFPLGTSPGWGTVSEIDVVFSCSDDMGLYFNYPPKHVFDVGRHYYMWNYEDESPNYDLVGKVGGSDDIQRFANYVNIGLYNASPMLAFFLGIFVYWGVWVLVIMGLLRLLNPKSFEKRWALARAMELAIWAFVASLALSFVLGLIVVGFSLSNNPGKRRNFWKGKDWMKTAGNCALVVGIICTFLFLFAYQALPYSHYYRNSDPQVFAWLLAIGAISGMLSGIMARMKLTDWFVTGGFVVTAVVSLAFSGVYWPSGLFWSAIFSILSISGLYMYEKDRRKVKRKTTTSPSSIS